MWLNSTLHPPTVPIPCPPPSLIFIWLLTKQSRRKASLIWFLPRFSDIPILPAPRSRPQESGRSERRLLKTSLRALLETNTRLQGCSWFVCSKLSNLLWRKWLWVGKWRVVGAILLVHFNVKMEGGAVRIYGAAENETVNVLTHHKGFRERHLLWGVAPHLSANYSTKL